MVIMTSYNNLALLFKRGFTADAITNAVKNGREEGSCNKPGGKGRPKAGPKNEFWRHEGNAKKSA